MDKNNDFEDKTEENKDEFGLPDVNYEPLEEEGDQKGYGQEKDRNSEYTFPEDDESSQGGSTAIILITIVVLLIAGGVLSYFFYFKPKMEKEKQEELVAKERKKKEHLARLRQQQEEARARAVADSIASAKESQSSTKTTRRGSISKLDRPTGRYHIVISSAVDDDLLMDYAKKLRRKGVSTKFIPPYGKAPFHRLTAEEDFATFQEAQRKANEIGSNYKYGVWVLKY